MPLHDIVTGALPIWIDAGYRLTPRVFVGADFEYARALVSTRLGCPIPGVNCSASDVVVGAEAIFHPIPDAKFDPWAGIGLGYETLRVDTQLGGGRYGGLDLPLQVGVDYKPRQGLSIGPFVTFGLGSFLGCRSSAGTPCDIPSVGLHEWLTIGVKAAFDVHVGK